MIEKAVVISGKADGKLGFIQCANLSTEHVKLLKVILVKGGLFRYEPTINMNLLVFDSFSDEKTIFIVDTFGKKTEADITLDAIKRFLRWHGLTIENHLGLLWNEAFFVVKYLGCFKQRTNNGMLDAMLLSSHLGKLRMVRDTLEE